MVQYYYKRFFPNTQDIMILVIDAYNVLKMRASQHISESERMNYIQRMKRYCSKRGHTAWLVFDGGPYLYPVTFSYDPVYVVYAGDYESADSYIQRLLYTQPVDNTLLITSDNELVNVAYNIGIVNINPSVFTYYVERALAPQNAGYAKEKGKARKRSGHDSSAYVDQLMQRASEYMLYKDEDVTQSVREETPRSQTPSRQEKLLYRIIRKL